MKNILLVELEELYKDYAEELAEALQPIREKLEYEIVMHYEGDIENFININLRNSDYFYLSGFVRKLYYADDVFDL